MKWLKKLIVSGVILSILSAAVLLHVVSYGVWGYRISVLCRSVSEHVGIIKSTEIATSSLLTMAITPSSAGGERHG